MILELQNAILEMIAKGEPLAATLSTLCLMVERAIPGVTATVLKSNGAGLATLAAPSLPQSYSAAVDGLRVGPYAGSCGTAAFLGTPVVVTDIEADRRWADYKALALPLGLRACWSSPIKSADRVVGTFAFYYREKRGPSTLEQKIVDACVHLCSIAIERDERVAERQRLTYTDSLTGLQNRAAFDLALRTLVTPASRGWGIIIADVDNLKLVNDTFGHAAGDGLIRVVAERIAAAAVGETIYRLGGDEFAVIVVGEGELNLQRKAAEILARLAPPTDCAGHVVFPAVTFGGALTTDSMDPEQVRQNADIALYHAKEHARGQFVEFHSGLGTALTRRFRAVRDVGLALSENRIEAYYQPIVRLDTREAIGLEALCRMRTHSGDVVAAAHFHEATKDAHVAAMLTERMLTKVAKDMRTWLDKGLPLQHVSVNLSAADFRKGGLRKKICQLFEAADVPLEHLILEVTESVYLGQRDHVVANEIKALRFEGLKVALDDFGTGYASLTHLLTVPVDIIKIDKSFIDRTRLGDAGMAIVEGLISIAGKLGIRVVAEGIEEEEQARRLQEFGCKLGQGYLFARAMDGSKAGEFLLAHGQRGVHTSSARQPLRYSG
ncbi:putative bifunctional diguanylate cyclase/phosphodiesterase [Rhizobium hainanense]|uniref:Diguanylate cyclase (GGDEF) domain-containing protein n=1 Tax=Rhizobium hainanense TaxID=52131 RepID=A0A1C3W9H9_9HYPH|nr:EAL domain-containing protein [Rhizobium hainanense]SCB36603.1 diguanylate cyclase (GGDEF) domain-containing protein [Rhizobium hainanense]